MVAGQLFKLTHYPQKSTPAASDRLIAELMYTLRMQTTDPAPKAAVIDELMSGAEYLESLRDGRAARAVSETLGDLVSRCINSTAA